MLVPDSATPLYLQLEEILRQEILSGSRREGDKLSTENELVEQYKVSRITVRRAVGTVRGRAGGASPGQGHFCDRGGDAQRPERAPRLDRKCHCQRVQALHRVHRAGHGAKH